MQAYVPSPQTTLLILLGASRWPFSPEFQASRAFLNAALELQEYFLSPSKFGLPHENLLNLFNSNQSSDDIDREIGQFLKKRMAEMKQNGEAARDLLVYFIGHGGFAGNESEFYLAIRRTRTDNPSASGIRVTSLAYTLKEKARRLRRVVILDCCFAAAAFAAFQAGPAQVALEKTSEAFEAPHRAKGFPTKGTALLCSSSHTSPSLLLPDGSSTMFTKALLEALAEGMPPQREHLSLRDVKDLSADFLSESRNAPRPVVLSPDQSEGDVADIPFFPNPRVEEERRRRAEEERRRRDEEAMQARKAEQERLRRRIEEERRHQAEEEHARKEEEERLRRAEEERERKVKEEQARQAEAERRRQEAAVQTRKTQAERQQRDEVDTLQILPASQSMPSPTEQSTLPSQTEGPPALVTPPSQTSLPPTEPASPARKAAALPPEGTHLPQLPGTHPAEMFPPRPPHRGLSRRTVVVGLVGLVVVGAAGGSLLWLTHSQQPVGTTLYTYRGHSSPVLAVAWSPDGRRIASAGYDNMVQVWDASDGSHVYTYHGHSNSVLSASWSPNGTRIASGSADKTVQVWNAADGGHVFTYKGHSAAVNTVAWLPNGTRIASGSDDETVQVWNAVDGSQVFTYRGHYDRITPSDKNPVTSVAWSPDGKRIASGSDHTLEEWDAATGTIISREPYASTSSEYLLVTSVAWSPDGKRIAWGSDKNAVVEYFYYGGHTGRVNSVAWSPDGKRIASASSDKTVQVWDASNGGNGFTYRGHSNGVNSVAWSPDGTRIASGSEDKTVQVWEAK